MLSCKKAAVALSKEMDEELSGAGRLILYAHLGVCSVCRRVRNQLRFQHEALRAAGKEDSGVPAPEESGLPDTAKERIKSALVRERDAD